MEERTNQKLDADYTKVNIMMMVPELVISEKSKQKLQLMLKKFPQLFGGGLGLFENLETSYNKIETSDHQQYQIQVREKAEEDQDHEKEEEEQDQEKEGEEKGGEKSEE